MWYAKINSFLPQHYFYSVSSRSSKLDTESESTNSSVLIQREKIEIKSNKSMILWMMLII